MLHNMLEEPFLHSPKTPSAVARLARTRLALAAAFLCGVALTAATFSLVPRHVPDATADALAAVHSSGLAPTTTLWEPAPEPIDEGKVRRFAAHYSPACRVLTPALGLTLAPISALTAAPAQMGHETPYKFAVKSVTPVSLQLYRGTCWIFAAIAVLEASYRRQVPAPKLGIELRAGASTFQREERPIPSHPMPPGGRASRAAGSPPPSTSSCLSRLSASQCSTSAVKSTRRAGMRPSPIRPFRSASTGPDAAFPRRPEC